MMAAIIFMNDKRGVPLLNWQGRIDSKKNSILAGVDAYAVVKTADG